VRFPAPTHEPVARTDTGRPDQASALVAWPLTDFFADMKGSRAGIVAGEVLQNRVLDKVRIQQGATYSPETEVEFSEDLPRYGSAVSLVEIPPAKIAGYFSDVDAIARAMAADGVTEDELTRARNPRVAGIQTAQKTNEYWLGQLSGAQADPRRLDLIRSTMPDYAGLTTKDVQAAAAAWFVPSHAWRMVVAPASQDDAARAALAKGASSQP
jgi:zinc protease